MCCSWPRSAAILALVALVGLVELVGLVGLVGLGCGPQAGRLEISVLDEAGTPTPARLELLDADGRTHIARDALRIRRECAMAPLPDWLVGTEAISNPYTGRQEFYADGSAHAELPAGSYRLTVQRGIEYRAAVREIEVSGGQTTRVEVPLARWIDMPAAGWVSADDHIHATRLTADDDAYLSTWMRAEDLHVANLLRMGTVEQFDITPQYAFGDSGAHREGDTLLLAGQEHPRTHVLGHTITLGAEGAIDLRETYLDYAGFWRASRGRGGASGYAHFGEGQARNGLAIDAPTGLLSFLEVLQFDLPWYAVLYDLWSLGVRIAPSAGTDFPCLPSIPGRERFYTRVEGPEVTRASWIEGVRAGRTFVTNGPLLELTVGEAGIGDELALDGPAEVSVRGRVRFDPARDDVQVLELVEAGRVAVAETTFVAPGEIALEATLPISASTWLALRVEGEKLVELPMRTPWYMTAENLDRGCKIGCGASMHKRAEYVGEGRPRPAAAHTAPVYVTVGGAPILPSRELVYAWLARLDAFEAQLDDALLDELVVWRPFADRLLVDGVPAEVIRRDRPALLAAIARARAHYESLLAGSGVSD